MINIYEYRDVYILWQDRKWEWKKDWKQSTKTAIPPNPPSTMPRKGEEPEPGYAQRFSLRDGK